MGSTSQYDDVTDSNLGLDALKQSAPCNEEIATSRDLHLLGQQEKRVS
jgi:hypothetical protein